jgi:heme/copper-type cytochrome/quinol oxidase subunit 1
MAFPVLNMLSFWTTFVAFVVMVAAFFVRAARRCMDGRDIRR